MRYQPGILLPNLRTYRRKAHMTQEELAEKAGICSNRLISGYENGGKRASIFTAVKLANSLGIKPIELMESQK
jgi:transcriptional regulator with XRE-family HTH domain